MHDATDDELIDAYRRGLGQGFEALYRRHAPGLYTYLRLHAPEAAEDILQETFSRVLACLPRYRPQGRFPGYLYAIARNLVVEKHRGPHREVHLDDSAETMADTGMDDRETDRIRVRAALRELPAEQREVVLLREYGGLTFAEISRLSGAPLGTVLTRMRRALERLRRVLAPEEVTIP